MKDAFLAVLENPSLPSNLAFKSISTVQDINEIAKRFVQISDERFAALKALKPKPECPPQYVQNFSELISKLATKIDFERHVVRAELQQLEARGGDGYSRRDELVDLWGRTEGAKALLKLLFMGAVHSGSNESRDPSRWKALIDSERKVAETLIGYMSVKYPTFSAELNNFLN